MKRLLGWLLVCLPVAAGAQSVQDSLAIAAIRWDTCCVRPHLVAVQAQLELFGAPQAISMVRYDAGRYRTRIVQPDSLTLTSVLAEAEGAVAAVNAGYFNVKTLVPSTFVRVGGRTVAATEAREEFRVNGVVAIKGRRVRIEPYVPADDARLARRYRDALAAGPLLLCRGEALSYADREGGFWGRHPRSVVGVTRQGEAVMIVVDGRFPGAGGGYDDRRTDLSRAAIGAVFGAEPRRRRFVDALVRGGGHREPPVRQPEVRPRGRTARHELHRGGGGVMPPFPIGKPRRSVASAFRRISEMPPPFPHLRKGGNSVFSRGAECAVISVSICLMPAVSRLRLLGFLNFVKNYC